MVTTHSWPLLLVSADDNPNKWTKSNQSSRLMARYMYTTCTPIFSFGVKYNLLYHNSSNLTYYIVRETHQIENLHNSIKLQTQGNQINKIYNQVLQKYYCRSFKLNIVNPPFSEWMKSAC